MTEIQVLDDFLSEDELSHIRDYLDRPFRRSETVSWQLQRTSDDSPTGLRATDFLYMNVTDVAFFNHYLLEKIQYELGVDYKAPEIYFNGQWPERHGSFHTDFSKKTVLIYISECDPEWGGFTQFYSSWDDCRQMKDPLIIIPKTKRLVCFPGELPHKGHAYNHQSCPMRISLAYKLE